MSDEEMVDVVPDFDQIKSSPPASPSQSTSSVTSLPSRENSVILEPRDVPHKIGKVQIMFVKQTKVDIMVRFGSQDYIFVLQAMPGGQINN